MNRLTEPRVSLAHLLRPHFSLRGLAERLRRIFRRWPRLAPTRTYSDAGARR